MDVVTRQTVTALAENENGPCVSMFIPTHRTGAETQQDPIRLKNAIDEATTGLLDRGFRRPDAASFLAPVSALIDDHEFWRFQEDGLAVFVSTDRTERYRVPVAFETAVTVGPRFRLRPLLHAMTRGEHFHIIALSENQVRLLWGTRYRVGDVDLPPEVPKDLAAAVWYRDPERQLQFRSGASQGSGRSSAVFHGHGLGELSAREDLHQFLRAVDGGLAKLGVGNEPVVLAGVGRLLSEFRRISELPNILDETIDGNVEHLSAAAIHRSAWAIAAPWFATEQESAIAQLQSENRRTLGLESTLPAVLQGRAASLFIDATTEAWGHIADDGTRVDIHEKRQTDDWELYDAAAAATLTHGGHVYLTDLDEVPGPIAATLRW